MKKQPKSKKVQKSVSQQPPTKNGSAPSKSSLKKVLPVVGVLLLILASVWGIRACSHHVYGRAVKDCKGNATLAVKVASSMLNDMIAQGARSVTDGLALNPQGQAVSCDDPAKAFDWRKQAFQQDGTMEAFTQLMKEIDNVADDVLDPPAGYQTEGEALASAIAALDTIRSSFQEPGKDIIAFAENAERLINTVLTSLEKTDFNFFLPLDDCKMYANRIAPLFKKSDISETLLYQEAAIDNRPVNALKYRQMGFQPLADGKGVLYKVIQEGHGPVATSDAQVKLHYEGKLTNGHVFDSSYSRGAPATMQPAQTVRGFNKAVTSMPVGSKWEVFIPADQAYGSRGTGEIKPNSDLLFTIEVLEIL